MTSQPDLILPLQPAAELRIILGAALVVTTHRDLGFATLARREMTRALAARVVAHLLGETSWPPPSLADLAIRLERQHGNLREVLFELYDEVERGSFPSAEAMDSIGADR